MKNHVVRLIIASGSTILGFVLVTLFTAFLASSPVKNPVVDFLPEVDEAFALIRWRLISPEMQAELKMASSMRVVFVEGHLLCDQGENVRIDVDITQASTGAEAKGRTLEPCTGEVQIFDAAAVVRGAGPVFDPGPAMACAEAKTRKGSRVTDTFAWCKPVTLQRK